MNNQKGSNPPVSPIKERIIATFIDWGIVALAIFILEFIPMIIGILLLQESIYTNLDLVKKLKIANYILFPFFTLLSIIAFVYYYVIWQTAHGGQTLGKRSQNLAVMIKEEDKIRTMTKADFRISLKRFLLGIVDSLFWGLVGLIIMLKHKQKLSLCDIYTDTIILQKEEIKTE